MSLRPNGIRETLIPHKHRVQGEGESIPVYHVFPANARKDNPSPCVVIYTGLDGYRTELMVWAAGFVNNGVAVVILEIPGTGDSPALRGDPESPDRQNSSLLDWLEAQEGIDATKIIVWGFSTGGMYAIRFAHTHRHRLLAVVALGGGAHHMFDEEWLDNVNKLEYPFEYEFPNFTPEGPTLTTFLVWPALCATSLVMVLTLRGSKRRQGSFPFWRMELLINRVPVYYLLM